MAENRRPPTPELWFMLAAFVVFTAVLVWSWIR